MAATHIHDLALIIEDLERSGRLARVTGSVDLTHDLAGLAAELESGPRAVLFEKVAGHEWPVLTGLYWSRELLADLLRREERTLPQYVSDCIRQWQQSPVDPVVVPSGPVLDVTEPDVDLAGMPIPIHAEKDGGPYFDAAVVIAKDPETGVRNASIQRFQVVAKDRMHVNIDAGRHLELYLEKAEAKGETLTFTLNCGVGPGLHFAAAAPAEAAPADADELGIASAFHGAPLELVKASNGHDDMVAHAMWALECEIVPGEVADEGPFAEVTGYYATVAPRPVVHVRKIHRRARPVFQTILSGVEVWNSVGLLGEANILQLLQKQVPGVTDVYMSHGGGGFYHCIVQLAQKRQGWSKQAILAAFSAFPPLKMVTIVDDDVDLRSAQDVEWAMATRLDPTKGIVTIDESFGHGLNPSFPDYLGPKVGFDATKPYPPSWAYERATYKPMSLEAVEMVQPDIVRRAAPQQRHGAAGRRVPRRGRSPRIGARPAAADRPDPGSLGGPGGQRRQACRLPRTIPDAWIARPKPVDLTPVRSVGRRSCRGGGRPRRLDRPAAARRPRAGRRVRCGRRSRGRGFGCRCRRLDRAPGAGRPRTAPYPGSAAATGCRGRSRCLDRPAAARRFDAWRPCRRCRGTRGAGSNRCAGAGRRTGRSGRLDYPPVTGRPRSRPRGRREEPAAAGKPARRSAKSGKEEEKEGGEARGPDPRQGRQRVQETGGFRRQTRRAQAGRTQTGRTQAGRTQAGRTQTGCPESAGGRPAGQGCRRRRTARRFLRRPGPADSAAACRRAPPRQEGSRFAGPADRRGAESRQLLRRRLRQRGHPVRGPRGFRRVGLR